MNCATIDLHPPHHQPCSTLQPPRQPPDLRQPPQFCHHLYEPATPLFTHLLQRHRQATIDGELALSENAKQRRRPPRVHSTSLEWPRTSIIRRTKTCRPIDEEPTTFMQSKPRHQQNHHRWNFVHVFLRWCQPPHYTSMNDENHHCSNNTSILHHCSKTHLFESDLHHCWMMLK